MAYPVRTVTVPSVLAGQPNGKLAPSILLETPAPGVTWPCRLVAPAARAWRALSAAAQAAGHTLKPSGPSDSYRPYEVQERIFRQRFTTTPMATTAKRTWQGRTWYLKPGYALAAVPGTSNHGRGIAVDVGEERDGDTGTESIDAGTLSWLLKNEERFGFSHEVQSEPWHIRYFAGDHVPPAVLDYERSNPSEEDDMPLTDTDILRIADVTAKVVLDRLGLELDDERAEEQAGHNRRRDTLAALFRRVLGVPVMANSAEQHKADEDTGRRFQHLLGDGA